MGIYDNTDSHFYGSIILFTDNYVPANWLKCDGSTLDTEENQVLFAVIGGLNDDNKTFNLPNIPSPVEGYQYIICNGGQFPTRN